MILVSSNIKPVILFRQGHLQHKKRVDDIDSNLVLIQIEEAAVYIGLSLAGPSHYLLGWWVL